MVVRRGHRLREPEGRDRGEGRVAMEIKQLQVGSVGKFSDVHEDPLARVVPSSLASSFTQHRARSPPNGSAAADNGYNACIGRRDRGPPRRIVWNPRWNVGTFPGPYYVGVSHYV